MAQGDLAEAAPLASFLAGLVSPGEPFFLEGDVAAAAHHLRVPTILAEGDPVLAICEEIVRKKQTKGE